MMKQNATKKANVAKADPITQLGYLALGSRLKRLSERLQGDAAILMARAGLVTQPGHFPLLAALDRHGPLSVTEAAEILRTSQPALTRTLASLEDLHLVTTETKANDKRKKHIALTPAGTSSVARMKQWLWPVIDAAVRELCQEPATRFLQDLEQIEHRLDEETLLQRAQMPLELVEYSDAHKDLFYTINAEWISSMFELEPHDQDVLRHPKERIIKRGGTVLFVSAKGKGIVGTCALMPIARGVVELTKMGVLEAARGKKAGEFLLAAALDRARLMRPRLLFLLSNKKNEAAIHLYEKAGFVHDPKIMAAYGKLYQRCNVAMSFPL